MFIVAASCVVAGSVVIVAASVNRNVNNGKHSMILHEWAARWGVSHDAVADLRAMFCLEGTAEHHTAPATPEGSVLALVRQEAAQKGLRVWRNNNGAVHTADGRFVRFGLANDSETVNKRIKSADLIGCRPIVITHAMVGHTIGQFVSREVKAANWHYTGTDREQAQWRWAQLVVGLGGDAKFATGVGTL